MDTLHRDIEGDYGDAEIVAAVKRKAALAWTAAHEGGRDWATVNPLIEALSLVTGWSDRHALAMLDYYAHEWVAEPAGDQCFTPACDAISGDHRYGQFYCDTCIAQQTADNGGMTEREAFDAFHALADELGKRAGR